MFKLLIIIYIAFISLGLPDSLLGSAWPVIYKELAVPISYAGIIQMIIAGGTVISSLLSARMIKKFGTARVTTVSVALTAAALLGFGLSHNFIFLVLLAIPLGLGAGSIDAALNNFVALHYEAKHMNWLHSFWGVGTFIGPMIMSFWLAQNNNWNFGYLTIGGLQTILVIVLIISLPLWKQADSEIEKNGKKERVSLSLKEIIKLPNVKRVLIAFFSYCAIEWTAGLWVGTYAVEKYGVLSETAARWTSIYFLGITLGRFLSGFFAIKISNKNLVRLGILSQFIGILVLLLPVSVWKVPVGIMLVGFGCAPIFPSMLHRTPQIFGDRVSQSVMGVQMAAAYIGTTFMPPLFGLIADYMSIGLFPFYLLFWAALIAISTEFVNGYLD
ncbi:sugar MFS transporter [Halanaerobium sp. ST460_2HS_T2]|uniref:MFS transporter n=1 Tax=Halanaerobium sp. ST460_2HS_T2 TaxID=2183914 RepID=UPI000DF197FB|nr:MFS transporter [Halanaerobium sp. ST460_2HS_T2]RCW52381.1 fucose permease [Halanaerobium sp. ST460_2HS_T2]